jgi:hypothetical protein
MSEAEQLRNKSIVAKYLTELWSKGNPDVLDELCSDDFVSLSPLYDRLDGIQAAKNMFHQMQKVSCRSF